MNPPERPNLPPPPPVPSPGTPSARPPRPSWLDPVEAESTPAPLPESTPSVEPLPPVEETRPGSFEDESVPPVWNAPPAAPVPFARPQPLDERSPYAPPFLPPPDAVPPPAAPVAPPVSVPPSASLPAVTPLPAAPLPTTPRGSGSPWIAPPSPAPPSDGPPKEEAPPQPVSRRPARPTRSGRGRFWGGFIVGFILLGLASMVALALALGFDALTLAEITGDSSAWTPPTLAPTPTPDPGAPAVVEGSTGRFAAGATVQNVTGSRVNVRRTPGHLGKESSDILAQLEPGEAVVILGETAQTDNLVWWRVAFQGVEGWVAEATASGVQILGEP